MSTSNITIPGLIDEKNSQMTKAEVQAMRDKFSAQQRMAALAQKKLDAESKHSIAEIQAQVQGYVANDYTTGVNPDWTYRPDPNPYIGGVDPFGDYIKKQQPYQQPWDKMIKPSPFRKDDYFDQQAILDQIAKLKHPKKSDFDELIDQLFTTAEKEQFLIDAGYMIDVPGPDYRGTDKVIISRKLSDGTVKFITTPLDELFLKEITVKFKNLLLAKATLKLKL